MKIVVVIAWPERQILRTVELPEGATAADAVRASGLATELPEVASAPIGVYSRRITPETRLEPGDRVEIYRPLAADPKEVRRRRARR